MCKNVDIHSGAKCLAWVKKCHHVWLWIDAKGIDDSGVFSTGAMGAMAPVILRKRLIAPAVSTRNGKILLTLGTRNIKILNTPL